MSQILNLLNKLQSTSSRLEKEAILTAEKSNELLQRVAFLALNPHIQFYIRKIPTYVTVGGDRLDQALNSLDFLSTRSITGNAAIDLLSAILSRLTKEDAQVIERVIEKDLKCGVSEATINKIWPGLIPTYPVLLASQYDQKLIDKIEWPAYVQTKMDGMRFNAIVKYGQSVEFRTRNGKYIDIPSALFTTAFVHLADHYKCDMVFDGELIAVDGQGKTLDRKTGNGIINKAVKGTMSEDEGNQVRAMIWDAIPFEDFENGRCDEPYNIRLSKLTNCFSEFQNHGAFKHIAHLIDTYNVDSLYKAQQIFEKKLSAGEEGIILKTRDGIWEDKRSKGLIKFKGEFECDLRVVDWVEGTGKNKGRLGALVCETSDGKLQCGLGTGFTDADRDSIGREAVGKIVAVKYNAKITDKKTGIHSLFLPVFVEIREDKTTADSLSSLK